MEQFQTGPLASKMQPTTNLQDIKDKHAHQPAKKHATPYHIHILPLLNHSGWKKTDVQKYGYVQDIFMQCYITCFVIKAFIFWS